MVCLSRSFRIHAVLETFGAFENRSIERYQLKFFFLLARRMPPVPSEIIVRVTDVLSQRGHQVSSAIAEEELTSLNRPAGEHDLYLLKSYTELSLSLAGALHAQGANLMNPYPACISARNKIICYQVLADAGIPVPRAWVTADFNLVRPLLRQFPVIFKPNMGWRGEGVCVVRNEHDLASLSLPDGPVLIQEYIENDGVDLRLYIVGNEVFGIRKRFSTNSFSVPGEPVAVSPAIRDIALRCGQSFGLHLYGIDVIEGADGPRVVDVNYFPGYKGVRDAHLMVADYIEAYAQKSSPLSRHKMEFAEVAG
jgi:ribosomal protein S6--L-glutamate ligase